MLFSGYLEAMVMSYCISRALGTKLRPGNRPLAYEHGRQWLKNTTGEVIPSWAQAVTQLEKQLSNK